MQSIVPPGTPKQVPEPREPWSLVDGCPECIHNVEPPFGWSETEHGWLCSYLCRDCGHIWTTGWGL